MIPATYERRLSRPVSMTLFATPAAVVVSCVGLLLVGLADRRGQLDQGAARLLFWVGIVVLFVPPAVAAVGASTRRVERVALVAWLGIGLYLVKLMQSPLAFTYHDEFSTMRTTQALARTGRLFEENALIPIHPWYPGLELVTSAISSLADVRVFVAGVIVIAVARLAVVILLFVLFERLAGSSRIGAVATVVYMTNPNFVFFDAQFAYESMALAFAALVLVLAIRPVDEQGPPWSWLLVALAAFGLAVTHHLTSYAVLAFLVLAVVVGRVRGERNERLTITTAVLLTAVAAWSGFVGGQIWDYLVPVFHRAWSSAVALATGKRGPKTLFHSSEGSNPWWEKLLALSSVLLILAIVPIGARLARLRRVSPIVLALAGALLVYPVLLLIRLTQAGTEVSNRSSEFIFVPIALFAALALAALLDRLPSWRGRAVLGAAFAVLLGGGIVIGWAPWAEVPGRYLVVADSRSIEPRGVAAADWASRWLPPRSRILTDRINGLLMGSYGLLDPQIGLYGHVGVSQVLLSPTYGSQERYVVDGDRIAYVVVDRRLSTGLPLVGYYAEQAEPQAFLWEQPLPAQALAKFDAVGTMSRVFDDGDIQVYATGR
jgi:hypothetical protein